MPATVPARRRRSNVNDVESSLEKPKGRKSLEGGAGKRQRRESIVHGDDDNLNDEVGVNVDEEGNASDGEGTMDFDNLTSSPPGFIKSQLPVKHEVEQTLPAKRSIIPAPSIVPAPPKAAANSNPLPKADNPSLLPQQAVVAPKSTRKLYVILSHACLEAYRIGGSKNPASKNGGRGKEGEVKYALLNCDDHQGILAKMGKDIADARPDITHQVSSSAVSVRLTLNLVPSVS